MNSQIIDKGNYKIHLYKTNNFKSIEMYIVFKNEVKEDNYLYAALCELLSITSKNYKSKIDRYIKEEELYNEDFDFTPSRYGIMNCIYASVSFINPKLVHDDYTEEAIRHPFNILNNPSFEEDKLEEVKNLLKFIYHRKIEKPASYVGRKARTLFFDNPLYDSHFYVDDEIVDTITMDQIKDKYYELINNSSIDIYLLGDVDDSYIEYIDKYNMFKSVNKKYDFIICNGETDKVKEETEIKKGIQQAQIFMLYNVPKVNRKDKMCLSIFNMVLGGSSMTSRLFNEVREKNQLCYSVYSRYNYIESHLLIATGVDKSNIDKALEVIKEVFSKMNKITDEELEDCKIKYLTNLDYIFDSLSNIFTRMLLEDLGVVGDLEEERNTIKSITKVEVENMYDSVKLNTVYVLRGE